MKASPFWSNNRPPQYCGICMEIKPLSDFMFINDCSHRYCSKCVGSYVSRKIRNNVAAITCPHPECKVGTLTPEMCKPVLALEVFNYWYYVLMKPKFSCPFKGCSGFVYTRVNSVGMCNQCYRLSCRICMSIWHPKLACKDVQQLRQDELEKEDLLLVELANNQGWKRCPFCGFYVERVSGCPNMLCRCGQTFTHT